MVACDGQTRTGLTYRQIRRNGSVVLLDAKQPQVPQAQMRRPSDDRLSKGRSSHQVVAKFPELSQRVNKLQVVSKITIRPGVA